MQLNAGKEKIRGHGFATDIFIALRITGFLDFVHRHEFWILENTKVRKLDLFPSSDEARESPTVLGPLERANVNLWSSQISSF
jgi:hypothetical protein